LLIVLSSLHFQGQTQLVRAFLFGAHAGQADHLIPLDPALDRLDGGRLQRRHEPLSARGEQRESRGPLKREVRRRYDIG
jgi:hypothetical protein